MLDECLSLAQRQELLLITDENHIEELLFISDVARSQYITVTPVLAPVKDQYRFRPSHRLPAVMREAIPSCNAMMVLTEYSGASTPYRMATLNYFTERSREGKAASMPGVHIEHFHYADVDYEEMDSAADNLATLLLSAEEARVETYDSKGRKHVLKIDIRRSNPTPCGGRIEGGDWDNIPSGETFILPRYRGKTEGSVAINGSVPGMVLDGRGECVFHISNNRIQKLESSSRLIDRHVKGLFFRDYGKRRALSRNATMLCELGFGVNKAIDRFHGLPIFDEKRWGTIHIAFGRNDQLGGKIKGATHHDLVVSNCSVRLNTTRKQILRPGRLRVSERDAYPDINRYASRMSEHCSVEPSSTNALGGVFIMDERDGELVMKWIRSTGTKCETRVGDEEAGRAALAAYRTIDKKMPSADYLAAMRDKGFGHDAALGVAGLLRQLKLIRVRKK